MQAVLMVRSELTADASLAEIRARSKFGIAIAAMIRIIATTIKSSISEKPFCVLRIVFSSPVSSCEPSGGPVRQLKNARKIPKRAVADYRMVTNPQGKYFQ